ncbi:MAG: hypothetical protein WC813_02430 [Patescibacteria group bacterium]|jgi:hypothetical protein
MNKKILLAIINIVGLCIVIAAVTIGLVNHNQWMGPVLIGLGILCLLSLVPFKVKVTSAGPDILFGIIDNGILAIMAIFGGHFGGIAGAVLGGVVGNAITDGIAGIFEGYIAEKFDSQDLSSHRTLLKSAVGKMAGCLLSAGAVLVVAEVFGW